MNIPHGELVAIIRLKLPAHRSFFNIFLHKMSRFRENDRVIIVVLSWSGLYLKNVHYKGD